MELIYGNDVILSTIDEQSLIGFIVKIKITNHFGFCLCLDNQNYLEEIHRTYLIAENIEAASWAAENLIPIIYETWLFEKKSPEKKYGFLSCN